MTGPASGNSARCVPGLRPTPRSRRGTAYVLVLAVGMIVMLIGLAGLTLTRIDVRVAAADDDTASASILATAAAEQALSIIEASATWRTDFAHGVPSPEVALGNGHVSFTFMDETGDDDLGDDTADAVRVYGTGRAGGTIRIHSVLLLPSGPPGLAVLRTAAHATDDMRVRSGDQKIARGGPLSAADVMDNAATVIGDLEAGSIIGAGMVCGTMTVPSPPKRMPPGCVFEAYAARATSLPYPADDRLQRIVLSPAANPYGTPNPDGLYSIEVPAGRRLEIRGCRILGTILVHLADGADLLINGPVVWEPARADHPALIVKARTDNTSTVSIRGGAGTLNESSEGVNFNPASTPYDGASDNDVSDAYHPHVTGLIHIIRPTAISSETTHVWARYPIGSVIADGFIDLEEAELNVDPDLVAHPPFGYGLGPLAVAPSSWRWETTESP